MLMTGESEAEKGWVYTFTTERREPLRRSAMTESAQPLTTTAVISVRWASPFQQQAGEKALREVLQAWREFYSEKNRGNVIEIDIGEREPARAPTIAS